ncbi:hypothetical protein BO221_14020 [Archangium sp. Cb G35]|uniref:hypothetical protein n=1 Tax=Archangium sp. Cb G35 TaxID=1920190 RepID=UPI0009359908|nr:hypothetical protein [Archangium sp. Cb G35]OJT24288.1 hypothetical protein BO221_14020 [Archangium sp. Cb G35]
MAENLPPEYREMLSARIKAAMQAQDDLTDLVRLATKLGRVDEAERLERLCGLAEGVEDGLRDISYEVDGMINAGHVTRLIVADVGVPQACLSDQHTPAPKNPRRCLYCYAFPLERIEEDARIRQAARTALGLQRGAPPRDDQPSKDQEDSRG